MYKDFIWDADGTLLDTIPGIMSCFKKIINEHNKEIDDFELKKIESIYKKQNSKMCIKYIEEKYNISLDDFDERYKILSNDDEIIKNVKLIEYGMEICKKIKESGKRNFIISNKDEALIKILEKFKVLEYFEDVIFIGKYNIFVKKPEVDAFKYLIDKYDLNPEETLSIGDRDVDVIASQKVNMKTCLFNPLEGFKTKPDHIIKSFKELEQFI